MMDRLFLGLLIYLQISIFVHILFIASYVSDKSSKSFKGFLITTCTNFLIGMCMLILMVKDPEIVTRFSLGPILVLESGLFFIFLMFIKVRISVRIIKRVKNPENYDISFFGKKVYKQDVVKKSELATYFLTLPFTLISGAYFLVNIFSR